MSTSNDTALFTISGKTALITGAGSGINFCFARALLAQNCNVVVGDLSLRPEAQSLVDKYSSPTSSPRAIFVKTDVVRWPDLENLFTQTEAVFGKPPDIVCPGAGVFEPTWSNFWHPPGTSESKDKVSGTETEGIGHYAMMDINLTHPIRCTQLAISRWLNPGPGGEKVSLSNPKRVIHISSIAGQMPGLSQPMYVASKHALNGFVRSLAPLEKIGVRVNAVAPGVIKTPLWTDNPEKLAMFDESIDEWVEPEEVAAAMVRCVEGDVGAGVVLEVTKGKTREVRVLNDPGPSGSGTTVTNAALKRDEVYRWLGEDGWGVPRS